MIKALLKNSSFSINGNDYDTPDGSTIRDYVHVSDLANAHVLALKYNILKKEDIICNLGTGIGVSVLDLINEIKKIEPEFLYNFRERRPGDPAYLVANSESAKRILNWEPRNSSLSNIINSSLAWYRKIL